MSVKAARKRATTLLAGIRAGGTTYQTFPSVCSKRSVAVMEAKSGGIRPLTVAGAAQVRWGCYQLDTLLLPVELRRVNHTASTNARILRRTAKVKPLQWKAYVEPDPNRPNRRAR